MNVDIVEGVLFGLLILEIGLKLNIPLVPVVFLFNQLTPACTRSCHCLPLPDRSFFILFLYYWSPARTSQCTPLLLYGRRISSSTIAAILRPLPQILRVPALFF